MQPNEEARKNTMMRVFEYAVSHAVKENEMTEHDGQQVLQCWADAEQLQDANSAAKDEKFKRSLFMKFGPAKGSTVFDKITKKRALVVRTWQEKKKQQQMQQGEASAPSSAGNSQETAAFTFSQGSAEQSLPSQPVNVMPPTMQPAMQNPMQTMHQPMMQQPVMQQQPQQHGFPGQPGHAGSAMLPNQLGQQGQPQGQQFNPMQMQSQPTMQVGGANPHQQQQQPQQQQPQHGVINTFNPLPSGMGGLPPPQLGGPHLLAPISHMSGPDGQPMLMQGGYGMGTMNGANNINSGPNNGNGNGLNMRPTQMNVPGTMPGGAPQNTMIYNTNNNYPPRPNFTPGMVNNPAAMANANALAAAKKATAATKRSAGAAGMDDADRKAPKKKATPSVPPQMGGMPGMGMPGRGMPGQPQMGNPAFGAAGQVGGVNRPLNTPGGFYHGQGGAPAAGAPSQAATAPAQPLTVAQEIDRDTERPNSVQEGLEPAGDNAVVAPLVTADFVQMQNDMARERLRMNLPGIAGAGAAQQGPGGASAASMMRGLNIPGAAPPVDEQPWLLQNVVDRSLMGRAVQRVLDGSSTKIGLPSLSIVSNAVQKHLKNVLEAAFKVAKSRVNKTAFNSYEGISKMIIEHGKGNALPENQQNIGILWAEDVQGILQAEEAEGRQTLRQYDAALEEALAEKMRAFDEERGKAGSKRRTGSAEADTAWWTKEDAAEKTGLLGWEDLAMTGFKSAVASRHELGSFAPTGKAKSRASVGASASSAAAGGASGSTAAGAAAGSGAQASGGASSGSTAGASAVLPVSAALEVGAMEATSTGAGASAGAAASWANQPCPLVMPRHNHIVIQDEDLAVTLARSSHNPGLPDTIVSSVRPTGSCLYKCKMGLYTGSNGVNL